MKKIKLMILAICASSFSISAQDLPQPSPYAEVTQTIGLTDVTIEYSRPGVKDREIFGGLLPFGKIWRTGANAPTQFVTSTELSIGGKTLPAGRYSIFTVPNDGEWRFIINKDTKASEGEYNQEKDAISIMIEPEELGKEVETMTFWFANVKENGADLKFAWDNTGFTVPIEVSSEKMAMKNIEEAVASADADFGTYNASARYYLEHEKDLDKALQWAEKSVNMSSKFYNVYTLSLIHHARGEYDEAIEAAEKSLKLAEEIDYEAYVKMNKENIAKWKEESDKKED